MSVIGNCISNSDHRFIGLIIDVTFFASMACELVELERGTL